LAARIGAFEALLCHAKITPAALHRGESERHCRESAEAAGANPKFGSSVFSLSNAGSALAPLQALRMAAS
jgi:hypothetical protein